MSGRLNRAFPGFVQAVARDAKVARHARRQLVVGGATEDLGHAAGQLAVVRPVPRLVQVVFLNSASFSKCGRISTRQLCIGLPSASAT